MILLIHDIYIVLKSYRLATPIQSIITPDCGVSAMYLT